MLKVIKTYAASIYYLGLTAFVLGLFWILLLVKPEHKNLAFIMVAIVFSIGLVVFLQNKNRQYEYWDTYGLIGHFTSEQQAKQKELSSRARTWGYISATFFSSLSLKEIMPDWVLVMEMGALFGLALKATIAVFFYERQLAKTDLHPETDPIKTGDIGAAINRNPYN